MKFKSNIGFFVFILTIITAASFLISGIIILTFGFNNLIFNSSKIEKINIVKEYDVKSVKNISIDASNTEINIIPSESKIIKLQFSGTSLHKNLIEFNSELENNDLKVSISQRNIVNIGIMTSYNRTILDVYLPETEFEKFAVVVSSGNIKGERIKAKDVSINSSSGCITLGKITGDAEIRSTSGIIKISNFKSGSLIVHATSGGISASDINAKQSDMETTSGCIQLEKSSGIFNIKSSSGCVECDTVKCEKLDVKLTSGNLDGENISTIDTKFKSSSGCMRVKKFAGNLDFESTSGILSLQYDEFNNNINARSTSGVIGIELPDDAVFNLKFFSNSGTFRSNFNYDTSLKGNKKDFEGKIKNSKNNIVINTTSGDGIINK
jgi:DUF4097 and DUF4098 domain-containing protein YvlB